MLSLRCCLLVLQELSDEQQPLLITPDNLDRIIVNRIIEAAPEQYLQQPFHYLLGCYSRAGNELRSLGQDAAGQQLRAALDACRQLLVSYAGLILMGAGVVPEVSMSCHVSEKGGVHSPVCCNCSLLVCWGSIPLLQGLRLSSMAWPPPSTGGVIAIFLHSFASCASLQFIRLLLLAQTLLRHTHANTTNIGIVTVLHSPPPLRRCMLCHSLMQQVRVGPCSCWTPLMQPSASRP